MSIDHTAILPHEVKELVRKRINELTEELRAKYDPGFRPGIYVLPAADKDELTDGFWLVFPPEMPIELAHSFMEAGYETMERFIDSGIIGRLKTLHDYEKTHPQPHSGGSNPDGVQPPKKAPEITNRKLQDNSV
jgi:hypothetical protein